MFSWLRWSGSCSLFVFVGLMVALGETGVCLLVSYGCILRCGLVLPFVFQGGLGGLGVGSIFGWFLVFWVFLRRWWAWYLVFLVVFGCLGGLVGFLVDLTSWWSI